MKVHVKWGKESFEVDVDTSLPALVFKSQLFTLTGVPPERQKIMGVKNPPLKDEADMSASGLKEGSKVMMMGSADTVPTAPAQAVVFVEDLPEADQAKAAMKNFSAGLENLGNTCYMNSTLQCLYSVPELRAALGGYSAQARSEYDGPHKLTVATRELFAEIGRSGSTVTPLRFLITLRQIFPQFAGQTNQGVFMQQDAEECWTRIMETLRTRLGQGSGGAGDSASPVVQQLFGIDLETRLRSAETGEERLSTKTEYTLKCNITVAVNFLAQGFRLALDETREGMSELAGRNLVFSGTSALTRLPPYLTVQLMRFDYRQDTRERCKILKEVGFSATMDVLDFCSDALKARLEEPRRRKQELSDKALGVRMQPAASGGGGADEVMADAAPQVDPSVESLEPELQPTGLYELRALVTHKGRTADGGHYVSYVKQDDGSWMEFDDERPIPHTEEQILRLKGGQGDHPSAYLLLYRSILA